MVRASSGAIKDFEWMVSPTIVRFQVVFKNEKALIISMIRNACQGNAVLAKEILDRVYGKVKQESEITGKNGTPLFPIIGMNIIIDK